MSQTPSPERHPFLDDLTDDTVLTSTALRRPVNGKENILRVIRTTGTFYLSQQPTFRASVPGREFLEYDAELTGGRIAHGVVVVERNPDGSVIRLNINFSPVDAVLSISVRLGELLSGELGDLFL